MASGLDDGPQAGHRGWPTHGPARLAIGPRTKHEQPVLPRINLPSLVLCAALLVACRGEPRAMQVEIAIDGMTCDSCVQAITHELERLDGVRSVEVDLEAGKAQVTFTEGVIEPAQIEQTIEKIGYQATPGEPASVSP